jgi:hypothetical protein
MDYNATEWPEVKLYTKGSQIDPCVQIVFQDTDNLVLDYVSKCGETNGTYYVRKLIQFAKQNNFKTIHLVNAPSVNIPCGSSKVGINLTYIKLLTIGNTWYSQFGFQSTNSVMLEQKITPLIDNSIENLIKQYQSFPDFELLSTNLRGLLTGEDLGIKISKFVKDTIIKLKSETMCDKLNNLKTIIELLITIVLRIVLKDIDIKANYAVALYYFSLELDLHTVSGGKKFPLRKKFTISRHFKKKQSKKKSNKHRSFSLFKRT